MQSYHQAPSSGTSTWVKVLGILGLLLVVLMGSCVTCLCGGLGAHRGRPTRSHPVRHR